MKNFLKETLLMSLDALERVIEISCVEVMAKNLAATAPLSFIGAAKAALQIAAIKAGFAVVKGLIGNFYTGGYTGEWGPDGRLAWLHQKELILNPHDTENFLDAIKLVKTIELNSFSLLNELGNLIPSAYTMEREAFQQEVYITAEFPNAVDHTEIEEAFNNLLNDATQYAFSRE